MTQPTDIAAIREALDGALERQADEIEELARAIGQKIEGPAEDMDSTWYGKPLWKSYVEEAQAILPIIDRLTLAAKIEGAELMREAAARESVAKCSTCGRLGDGIEEHCADPFHWITTPQAIRALDAAAIVGGQTDAASTISEIGS